MKALNLIEHWNSVTALSLGKGESLRQQPRNQEITMLCLHLSSYAVVYIIL